MQNKLSDYKDLFMFQIYFTFRYMCSHYFHQVETDRISKYVLEIKDVLEFKDART